MEYKYLKNSEIDRDKWNTAISQSLFPLTYAYSWYLDSVSVYWDAIIGDEYDFVMPLPYRTRFNSQIVYQPLLIPKLGYFFSKMPSKSEITGLFDFVMNKVNQFELILNKFNVCDCSYGSPVEFMMIDLYNSYNQLRKEYSGTLKELLFSVGNSYIVSGLSVNEVIEFLNNNSYFADDSYYDSLRMILSITTIRRLSKIYGYYSIRNELLGVAIFIYSTYTADMIIIAAKDDDETIIAALIDRFIKDNSGKTFTLNFESIDSDVAIKLYPEFNAVRSYNTKVFYKRTSKFFRMIRKQR